MAASTRIPLMIDNTFATPYLCRPFEWGANIIVHSTTKFIGGHGTTIGGVIVDGGNFDWTQRPFPQLHEPDPSYHGLVYADLVGARPAALHHQGARADPARHRRLPGAVQLLADDPGPRDPEPAHGAPRANTQAVAEFLEGHPSVCSWVMYPGLPEPSRITSCAKKYLPKGAGAILGFGIKGGVTAGKKFIDSLKLFSHLANVGDAKSLAIHPATHHPQPVDRRGDAQALA